MTYDISYIGKHIGTVVADSVEDASQKVMDDIDIVPVASDPDEFEPDASKTDNISEEDGPQEPDADTGEEHLR